MKQNGYLGYEFKIGQDMKDEPTLDAVAKAENDKGIEEVYEVIFAYEIKHLDWKSIKENESEETFNKYRKGLGIYIVLTNKASKVSGVFRIGLDKIDDEGNIKQEINLMVGKSGQHKFTASLYDNYGFSKALPVAVRAAKLQ